MTDRCKIVFQGRTFVTTITELQQIGIDGSLFNSQQLSELKAKPIGDIVPEGGADEALENHLRNMKYCNERRDSIEALTDWCKEMIEVANTEAKE